MVRNYPKWSKTINHKINQMAFINRFNLVLVHLLGHIDSVCVFVWGGEGGGGRLELMGFWMDEFVSFIFTVMYP